MQSFRSLLRFGRIPRSAPAVFLGFYLVFTQCRGEGIVNITFDRPPMQPPGTAYSATNYAERGTRFVGYFTRTGSGSTNRPNNGTAYIQPTGIFLPTGAPATCSRFDGLTFRLLSVELAGYSSVVPDYTAMFEGHRSDGSIVTTNFDVSGLAFQTYHFASDFADLTNVLIAAGALDNLKLQLPTVQPVLSLWSYHYYSDSWIVLEAQGTVGLRYRMEYTDVLPPSNWMTLTNFESSFFQVEHVSTNLPPQRFFRAVELP